MTEQQKQRVEEIRDKLKYVRPSGNILEVSNGDVDLLLNIIDQLAAENDRLKDENVNMLAIIGTGRSGVIELMGAVKERNHALYERDKATAENEALKDLGSVIVAENKYQAMATFRERHKNAHEWIMSDIEPYSPNTRVVYYFKYLQSEQAKRIAEIAKGPPSIEALREIQNMAEIELNQREGGKE